jgi:hypothetical protein
MVATRGIRQQLQKLWSQHSTQEEQTDVWKTKSRKECEEGLAAARWLWSQSEALVYHTAAEDDEDCDMVVLLTECKNLLSACDDLVVMKEEILRLYDLSTNTSVTNYFSDDSTNI